MRQHFGRKLKEEAPDTFREANRRLYEHYKALPEKLYGKHLPDTLEEMRSLFSAIAHGCAAVLHNEAWAEIYRPKVLRGGEAFINHMLGASSADLGVLANFSIRRGAGLIPAWVVHGRPARSTTPASTYGRSVGCARRRSQCGPRSRCIPLGKNMSKLH